MSTNTSKCCMSCERNQKWLCNSCPCHQSIASEKKWKDGCPLEENIAGGHTYREGCERRQIQNPQPTAAPQNNWESSLKTAWQNGDCDYEWIKSLIASLITKTREDAMLKVLHKVGGLADEFGEDPDECLRILSEYVEEARHALTQDKDI